MSQDPINIPTDPRPTDGGQAASGSSTSDVAKNQASELKDTSKNAAQGVIEESKHQATRVVAEAGNQASDLLRQGIGQINSQAGQQQQRLAESVHSMAHELGAMASASDQSGPMTGVVQEASRRGGEVAHWLENHEPGDILDQLRSFARRRPATFLLGAAAAGVLVGRLTRGLAAEAKNEDHSGAPRRTMPEHQALPPVQPAAVEPAPAGSQPISGTPAGPEFSPGPAVPAGDTRLGQPFPSVTGEAGQR
jgi:hypothetical protein